MPATRYKILHVGSRVGKGAMRSLHVGIAAVAKAASVDQPYAVVNELICNYLARSLLLPIPPGFIIEHEGKPHYVSLNFNLSGEELPPANVDSIVSNHPDLSCGIVLFDIWIINDDRHNGNIAYDSSINKVQIFDHSHAFLRGKDIKSRLESKRTKLGIEGHCLAPKLNSLGSMRSWIERIGRISEFYIRGVVQSSSSIGLQEEYVDLCSNYLLERRKNLIELTKSNKDGFPNVQKELWDNLEE